MSRIRIAVASLLCVGGIFLSLILLSKHYGVPLFGEAVLAACGVGEGCDVVSQSHYAMFLGLPLAAWGIFFYGALFALLVPSAFARADEGTDTAPSFGFFLVALAIVLDLVLLGLQAFVIKAFCKFCLGTYAVNILMLLALLPFRQMNQALNFVFVPQSRKALFAWLMAVLAVGASAVAGNSALNDRKNLASSSILGTPTMLQAPEKALPSDDPLAQARAEAKKWKATLDNPQLLQMYLAQKARDDFNSVKPVIIDISRAPDRGNPKAPISVTTFSDFMCPFCRDLAVGLRSFLKTSGDALSLHYKEYPLDTACNSYIGRTVHPGACELARGGVCAAENGRFWEYHDKVFAQTWDRATREDVLKISESVGLDRARTSACLDSASTKGRLAADIDEASRLAVGETPTIFVNGRKLASANVFFLAVEEERKRLNLPPFTSIERAQEK